MPTTYLLLALVAVFAVLLITVAVLVPDGTSEDGDA